MRGRRSVLAGTVTVATFGIVVAVALRPDGSESQAVPVPPREVVVTPERNRVNLNSRNLPDSFDVTKGTNVRWSADLGTVAHGGPVVAGGRVFVGTNNENPRDKAIKGDKGVVMCFDEKTGKFLWQIIHDKLPSGRVNDRPLVGIGSSPAVEGDYLYYVSNRAEVVCAAVAGDPKNPGQGKIVWSLDMMGKLGVYPHNQAVCSPLIVGDTLFVVTGNGVEESHIKIPAPDAPSFLALDKATGKVRWQSNLPTKVAADLKKQGAEPNYEKLRDQGALLLHGQWSNPAYASVNKRSMVLFPGGDGWLYAFTPETGDLLWKFDCNPKDAKYVLGARGTRNHFMATPVVWEGKVYLAVGEDPEHKEGVGHLWCIDPSKEPKNAEKDVSPDQKESALVWHVGGPTKKGAERPWHIGRTLASCAVHDGLCYASDLGGVLYCFDARTGEMYWEHDTEAQAWSSPYYADGKVYFGNDDGIMYVFPHGKKKAKPVQVETEARIRVGYCATKDTLFLSTEKPTKLYAISKK